MSQRVLCHLHFTTWHRTPSTELPSHSHAHRTPVGRRTALTLPTLLAGPLFKHGLPPPEAPTLLVFPSFSVSFLLLSLQVPHQMGGATRAFHSDSAACDSRVNLSTLMTSITLPCSRLPKFHLQCQSQARPPVLCSQLLVGHF